MTTWRMPTTCLVTKATDKHSEYVILIAFPIQQRLHVRPPILRYMQIASLVRLQKPTSSRTAKIN
jgi:hypothetical protein